MAACINYLAFGDKLHPSYEQAVIVLLSWCFFGVIFLAESDLMEPNPLEWPERHVLQNLENFEKIKQKMR